MRWIAMIVCAAAALAGACGSDSNAKPTNSEQVIAAWKAADLGDVELKPLNEHALGKGDCQQGQVKGIETTLCVYEDEAAARAAQKAGLKYVGEKTGSALASGKMLLVVADRKEADPEGRTINKLTKTFLGR